MIRRSPFLPALVAVLLTSTAAWSAPRWVRASYSADPSTTVTISWNTDGAADSQVEYGPDTSYGQTAAGSSENLGGDLGVNHTVTLTGLSPDAPYHYRAGSAGDWSSDHVFFTGPQDVCAPIKFGVAADNRGDFSGSSLCWEQVYQSLADNGVAFVINTGDLVKEGQNDNEWADFLDRSEALMGEIPIMPCLDNHDDGPGEGDGALFNRLFALPRNPIDNVEDYHSFDYGNVHFVALSTESFKGDGFQTQAQWLSQDLAATDRMWKVVYLHGPIYSSGSHGTNEDGQSPVLIPVFDQHHVDLVIAGHDHIYERYHPLVGWPGQEVASYDEGTCYLVSGGGGAATDPIYAFRTKEDGLAVGDDWPKHHHVTITVTNNVMHVRADRVPTQCLTYGTGGTGTIDEFDIVKTLGPGEDPCQGGSDSDGDGYTTPVDCDDTNPDIHPGAPEVCGDGVDQNCDGQDEACPCEDADDDGYESDACGGTDCDDGDAGINPGVTEICADSVDNDCDGTTDEAECGDCVDADGDGYNADEAGCPSGRDCDDADPAVNPGALEVCNGTDDDCNGQTDEGDVCSGDCVDADGDGHQGQAGNCPAGDDCDDGDAAVHPGAEEICGDGIDQDCSGQDLACGCGDGDLDGFSDAACGGRDCDDQDAAVHPDADESCNGRDDDCDGQTDDLGTEVCGIGPCTTEVSRCADGQPQACVPLAPPEATESSCGDGVDNDCNGYVDAEDPACADKDGCGCGSGSPSPGGGLGLLLGLLALLGGRRPVGRKG